MTDNPTAPQNPSTAARARRSAPTDPDEFLDHVRLLANVREEVRNLTSAPVTATAAQMRQAKLDAMREWQGTARAVLSELQSNRTGDPRAGGQGIPGARSPEVSRLQKRLIVGMSKNASRIASLESSQRRWHVAAKAAREGIAIRRDVAGATLGAPLKPDARLHLTLAHATFMLEGNSPRLRRDLAAARTDNPRSRGIAYWLARYEMMAGHHAEAVAAIQGAADYPPIHNMVLPLLDPGAVQAPWLTWPCNFYTYRHSLTDDDELRGMQSALAALTNNPQVVQNWLALGIPQVALDRLRDRALDASLAMNSLLLWNQANRDTNHSKYAAAVRNYQDCQRAIVGYFKARYPFLPLPTLDRSGDAATSNTQGDLLDSALDILASRLINYAAPYRHIWTHFRTRYMSISLEELRRQDWVRPNIVPLAYEFAAPLPDYGESTDLGTALVRLLIQANILRSLQVGGDKVEEKIDAPLLAIALVFCPLGIAEASRFRRDFDEGLRQCRQLLRRHAHYRILSEIVEKPFVKILKGQILLAKADSQYKAKEAASTPATLPNGNLRYLGLAAAETYQGVLVAFQDQGQYVTLVDAAATDAATQLDALVQRTFDPVAARDLSGAIPPLLSPAERKSLAQFGKRLALATVVTRSGDYPEPDTRIGPHESLIEFVPPPGVAGPGLLETNPVIYALLLEARSRLLQMELGLNYLGYRDDYTPPWRFTLLLDRARYFVEHAKNAQREYLNFLTNAEREEFQEQTAAQNVEMEKSNVRIDSARVDQATGELEAAKASSELAQLAAANAQTRLAGYTEFDAYADDLQDTDLASLAIGMVDQVLDVVPGLEEVAQGIGDFFGGGAVSNAKAKLVAAKEREFEKLNLALTVTEANQAVTVAQNQLEVATAGLQVAALQRAAAVLRHEYALQNLAWLRNRTLSAEMWYRLASSIRGVADTYLRYAVETAFLAEQAYEFEADKRMDVVRFDYDVSELGDLLAGDFLLRDLDTLEQDLLVTHQLRQQRVRYVMSMARDFPAALQEVRDSGSTTFSIRLESIERRFPGLFNVRVASVELLPIALLDATRFSLQLTHLGSGDVRLKANGRPSSAPVSDDWLTGLSDQWSVRPRVTGPETAVYSGMVRSDAEAGYFGAGQRGAFEGLAGASAWRLDMSMRENRVAPDSLADILVTFTLSGYFDRTLRAAVDNAPHRTRAVTSWVSAHRMYPDAYYEFHQSGRLRWSVTTDMLALRGRVGALRNLAILAIPAQERPELGRLSCTYEALIDVDAAGGITALTHWPPQTITTNGLAVDATFDAANSADITLDFGDGTGLASPAALPHTYSAPGRYEMTIRIADAQRLTEYRATVVVSAQHSVPPPVVCRPQITTTVDASGIAVVPTASVAGNETLDVNWRLDGRAPDIVAAGQQGFWVQPGTHALRLVATRSLSGRFVSRQRFDPTAQLQIDQLHVSSNRTFDDVGNETTAALNSLGQVVFGAGSVSPVDDWELSLPLDINPCLATVSATDILRHDIREVADVVLVLEYNAED